MNGAAIEEKNKDVNVQTIDNKEELMVLSAKPGTQENNKNRQENNKGGQRSVSKLNSSQPRTASKSKPYMNRKVPSASKSTKKTPLSVKKTPKWQKNAANDNKQKSMLDFFRPMFGKAKQTVMNIGAKFSPTSLLSPQSKSKEVTKNVTESVNAKDCDNSEKSDQVVPSVSTSKVSLPTVPRPIPHSSSGTSDKPSVIIKPWPLKTQATSKSGKKISITIALDL